MLISDVTRYTQAAAGFEATAPDPAMRRCGTCAQWRRALGNGTCALVDNQPLNITEEGTCNLWMNEATVNVPPTEGGPDPLAGYPYTPSYDPFGAYTHSPVYSSYGNVREMIDDGTLTLYTPEAFPAISAIFDEEMVTAEFKGSFPNIPINGIDMAVLTTNDPEPFFLTMPLGEVGMKSQNGLLYTQSLWESIIAQINTEKPTGIRGHIKAEERHTAYPNPEVYWLAAIMENGRVWAKGYIPPGEAREEYRIKKATGGKAATSIYGKPLAIQKHKDGSYTPLLNLEHVDLAPPKRAAHGKQYDFVVTSEMSGTESGDADELNTETHEDALEEIIVDTSVVDTPVDSEEERKEAIKMDRQALIDAIRELSTESLAELIGDDRAAAVAEMYSKKHGKKLVEETAVITTPEAVAEMEFLRTGTTAQVAELQATITEQNETIAEFGRIQRERLLGDAVDSLFADWNVKSDDGKAVLASAKDMVRSAALSLISETVDETTAAAQGFERHKPILEITKARLGGGNFVIGEAEKPQSGSGTLATQEEADAARARIGV